MQYVFFFYLFVTPVLCCGDNEGIIWRQHAKIMTQGIHSLLLIVYGPQLKTQWAHRGAAPDGCPPLWALFLCWRRSSTVKLTQQNGSLFASVCFLFVPLVIQWSFMTELASEWEWTWGKCHYKLSGATQCWCPAYDKCALIHRQIYNHINRWNTFFFKKQRMHQQKQMGRKNEESDIK